MRETWYTELVQMHYQEAEKFAPLLELQWEYNPEKDRVEFVSFSGGNYKGGWWVDRRFWEDNTEEMPSLVKERIRVSNA